MKQFYIFKNRYQVKYFKSKLGFIKVLLNCFIDQRSGFMNMLEYNLPLTSDESYIKSFIMEEIRRIEMSE